MNNQIKQHVIELIEKLEDQKNFKTHTPLFIYVDSDLYFRFKICCYTQNIEPFEAVKRYMISASSKQTVDSIKKVLGGES